MQQHRVVVITGGSSGLGRETALRFAREGYRVAVAARRPVDLEWTARACRGAGAEAMSVVTDVTEPRQVEQLVEQVIERWGRIDVWVNNAGVTFFAPLDQGSLADHRAVIETNLLGAMAAARCVIPVFERQHSGTLINVGSVLSHVAQPFVPAYVASKFGLRGLTEALRVQFADEPSIHVCGIYPFSIDTPHFESGGNAMAHQARAIPPVQSPEKVARAIVRLARRPRPRVYVPRFIALGVALNRWMPRTTERLVLHALRQWHFDERRAARGAGNLRHAKQGSGGGDGRARTHGTRRPRIGPLRFDAWVARDLVQTELSSVREYLWGRMPGGGQR